MKFENLFLHQNRWECLEMLARIRGCGSVLEVGSCFGHTLTLIALSAMKGAKVCSIDLGKGAFGEIDTGLFLLEAVRALRDGGYDAHAYLADSRDKKAIAFAHSHGPFDFVFIDGDHSYEGALADWENYGPLGKIVGFHDIVHPDCGVSRLWEEIKKNYKTEEIVKSPMGIGLVYR